MGGKTSTPSMLEREGKRLVESLGLDEIGYELQQLGEGVYIEIPTGKHFMSKGKNIVPYTQSGNLD